MATLDPSVQPGITAAGPTVFLKNENGRLLQALDLHLRSPGPTGPLDVPVFLHMQVAGTRFVVRVGPWRRATIRLR